MSAKSVYSFDVEPECVDFSRRMTITAMGRDILNTAGRDAQLKGFGVDVLSKTNLSWALERFAMEVNFRPKQYSKYSIATWVKENSALVSTRDFELALEDGTIFSRAISQWCLIDLLSRRPVLLQKIMPLCEPYVCPNIELPISQPMRLREVPLSSFKEHEVVYSDVDFNSHMNTMNYLQLMFDMLPLEMFKENKGLRMDVGFMHEAHYGDKLLVGYGQNDNISNFEIKRDTEVLVRARMEWSEL
ncbi:MAG: acyl-ACP thioesterase [Alistipes sp.]|nr:acyl-ACP thioesterase [Candidatus Alistipes equi]